MEKIKIGSIVKCIDMSLRFSNMLGLVYSIYIERPIAIIWFDGDNQLREIPLLCLKHVGESSNKQTIFRYVPGVTVFTERGCYHADRIKIGARMRPLSSNVDYYYDVNIVDDKGFVKFPCVDDRIIGGRSIVSWGDDSYGGKAFSEAVKRAMNYRYGTSAAICVSDEFKNYRTKETETMNPTNPITKVIFNDPATIVFWKDGTKTIVKCQEGTSFDPEKGLAMAISRHYLCDICGLERYDGIFNRYVPRGKE